jgi:DNA-binding transcriptional ArsR family regulator
VQRKAPVIRNPFEYGRELDRDELVDRESELAEMDAAIRNRGKLFLIGPRRFGKTSLLHACALEAERQGTTVLRFDAEMYESLPLLAQAILGAAVRAMKSPLERIVRSIADTASRLRPRIDIDGQGSISVTLEKAGAAELPVLADVLDAVEALAEKLAEPVAVMLDEVQAIVIDHGLPAEKQLRATVQRHRHVSYLFAGSSTRLLTAMTSDPDRSFYRLGSRIFLGPVPRQAFLTFLRKGFTRAGFDADEPGFEAILELAEEVPYNVQRLASEAWEMLRSGDLGSLTPDGARVAVERIVIKEDPAYSLIWTRLTRNQRMALRAIIERSGEGLRSVEVIGPLGMSASSMHAAIQGLETAHLIRASRESGRVRYRLVDPFLAAWLGRSQAP